MTTPNKTFQNFSSSSSCVTIDTQDAHISAYLPTILSLKEHSASTLKALVLGKTKNKWLDVLRENNFEAHSIDFGLKMTELPFKKNKNLKNIKKSKPLEYLSKQQNNSIDMISNLVITESLSIEILKILANEALRVLKLGGYLIFETTAPEKILENSQFFHTKTDNEESLAVFFSVETVVLQEKNRFGIIAKKQEKQNNKVKHIDSDSRLVDMNDIYVKSINKFSDKFEKMHQEILNRDAEINQLNKTLFDKEFTINQLHKKMIEQLSEKKNENQFLNFLKANQSEILDIIHLGKTFIFESDTKNIRDFIKEHPSEVFTLLNLVKTLIFETNPEHFERFIKQFRPEIIKLINIVKTFTSERDIEVKTLQKKIAVQTHELEQLNKKIDYLNQRIFNMSRSASWKVTKPMRMMKKLLVGERKKMQIESLEEISLDQIIYRIKEQAAQIDKSQQEA